MSEDTNSTEIDKELLQPMIDALVMSARRTLEYNVVKYSIKRYNSLFLIKSYYKKKLYKAILELREFNKQNPEEEL